jgi:hypothetical protein
VADQYLKAYAKAYKKKLAADAILKDLHPLAFKELKKHKEGKAVVSDVEFHLTNKVTKKYPDEVTDEINRLREDAFNSGKVKTVSAQSFDAQIPKSTKEKVLATITDYKKHFSL